jgi:very-short-patch-repair endonuclease
MSEERTTRLARGLRQRETDLERRLWQALRNRKALGLKFRRQHPVGPYVVDFVCIEARLAVEIDGYWHESRKAQDNVRDGFLREQRFDVVRFDIKSETADLETLAEAIAHEARVRIRR